MPLDSTNWPPPADDDDVFRVLCAAKKRIALPCHWQQGAFKNGFSHDSSTAWCAVGALLCENTPDHIYIRARDYMNQAAQTLGFKTVYELNDYSSHEDVLDFYDRAIELRALALAGEKV